MSLPSMSPDGRQLAFVRHTNERQCVYVQVLPNDTAACMLEFESGRERVRWCDWSGPLTLVCGTLRPIRSPSGVVEETRLHALDIRTRTARIVDVSAADGLRDRLVHLTPADDPRILVQHDVDGRGFPRVSEIDLYRNRTRVVVPSRKPVRQWLADRAADVRLGIGYNRGVASLHTRRQPSDSWSVLLEHPLADSRTLAPLAFSRAAATVYALSSYKGRAALFEVDLAAPARRTLLFHHPIYDVTGPVILDPRDGRLIGVVYSGQAETAENLDDQARGEQAWLDDAIPGHVNLVIDRSEDNRWQLVRSQSDIDPPSLYLFDSMRSDLHLLGHDFPELEQRTLARMERTSYQARDGQVIPAYLTVPAGIRPERLPAVVLPHGGPEARDRWGFDPLVQWLAAQGYGVLQMNFRGSTGYGAAFQAAGLGQWGGLIQNDITDGTRWLIERGVADPNRICIVGRSFGGYAALVAAARQSEWYSCAGSYAGVADLLAYSQYSQRLPSPELWRQRLGTDAQGLWQMSPIARVRFIETPLLIAHGRNDAIVPVTQARRFVRALRDAGKRHSFMERDDCDHEMTVESCRLEFYAELELFLSREIGLAAPRLN